MSSKVAPKTFNQVRNALYFSAAMWGFLGGRYEKIENDRIWAEHQKKEWADAFQKKEAARLLAHPPAPATAPAALPEELHELYQELNKA
mmetsp:Transcript_5433/g.10016  ORF Transcript_5433/g.10016 Transcript_5433/m.10016 type:complete len:89 (-) Transcript_5433:31-297(-)